MFDIGWSELLVIGVVALIADRAEGIARRAAHPSASGWARSGAWPSEFQGQFQEAMREAEMADLKKQVDDRGQHGAKRSATSIRWRTSACVRTSKAITRSLANPAPIRNRPTATPVPDAVHGEPRRHRSLSPRRRTPWPACAAA